MNQFEKQVCHEYVQNHAKELVKDAAATASEYPDDMISFDAAYQHEINIAARYRINYLFLQEYHRKISEHLAKRGIELPDFEEL